MFAYLTEPVLKRYDVWDEKLVPVGYVSILLNSVKKRISNIFSLIENLREHFEIKKQTGRTAKSYFVRSRQPYSVDLIWNFVWEEKGLNE